MERSSPVLTCRTPRSRALRAGFWAAGLLLATAVALGAWQQNDDLHLRRSLSSQARLSDVLSLVQDADRSVRGFLLAGDPTFLTPYHRARLRMQTELQELGTGGDPDPMHVKAYADARTTAREFMRLLDDILAARVNGDDEVALNQLRSGRSDQLLEEFRLRVDAVEAVDDAAYSDLVAQLRIKRRLSLGATVGLTILLVGLAQAAIREARRGATLARFLPSEIAEELADAGSGLARGTQCTLAVAFVDLRASTTLAAQLPPGEFMALLADFRARIMAAARASSGVVDKFIGDGALVLFGIGGDGNAAADALRFADRLVCEETGDTPSGERPRFGIGMHHGPVFCGVLGDNDRVEFTALGATVNLASRLEAKTKELGAFVVVSAALIDAAGTREDGWRAVEDRLPGLAGTWKIYVR